MAVDLQNVGSESIRSARLAEEESDEGTADCEGPNKEAMAVKENDPVQIGRAHV